MSTVRATTYLVLAATRASYGWRADPETGLKPVESMRVVKSLANRPEQLSRDQLTVKVTVEVPANAFDPIAPAALVVVPEDLIDRRRLDISAEAGDASGGDH